MRTFGATGNGTTDDAPAIAAAIKEAMRGAPGTTVFFPSGRYLLDRSTRVEVKTVYPSVAGIGDVAIAGPALIALQNAHDVSLVGEEGTLLIARDTESAVIGLAGCRNVTVRQLAMDFEQLLFTQGTVVAVDAAARTIDLRLDAGYPDPTSPLFKDARAYLSVRSPDAPDVPKMSTQQFGDVFFSSLADLKAAPGGVFRWSGAIGTQLRGVAAGDRFAFPARDNAHPAAVGVWSSQSCTFERVTVHSAPGLAYALYYDDGLTFRDCVIEPPAGTDRLISTNADGIHSKWNRTGPTLEGCRFRGMHDDGFTFHGSGSRVLKVEGASLTVERFEFFRAGDELAVIDQGTGRTRGTAKIVDAGLVRWRDQVAVRVTLDAPVGGTVSWEALGGSAALPARLDQFTAPEKRPDLVADLAAIGSGFAVRRSSFSRYRGGNRIYAWNGVIEDSRFERASLHPLQLGMELYWPEVYEARGVVIRRNEFVGNAGRTNLRIQDLLGTQTPGQALGNRDIQITDNKFQGYGPSGAVLVSNAEDVRLGGNEFSGGATDVPIALDLCRSVSIETSKAVTVSTTARTEVTTLSLKGPVTTVRR